MIKVLVYPILVLVLIQLLVFIFSKPKNAGPISEDKIRVKRIIRYVIFLILGVGALTSIKVYLQLPPDLVDLGINSGYSYEINADTSKRYNYQMEQFGGKANIAAMEFRNWVFSFWQGKQLVYSLLTLTAVSVLMLLLVSRLIQ